MCYVESMSGHSLRSSLQDWVKKSEFGSREISLQEAPKIKPPIVDTVIPEIETQEIPSAKTEDILIEIVNNALGVSDDIDVDTETQEEVVENEVKDEKLYKPIGFSKFERGWKLNFFDSKKRIAHVEWLGKTLPWSEACLFSNSALDRRSYSPPIIMSIETVVWFYFNNRYPERGDIWFNAQSQDIFKSFIKWLNSSEVFCKTRL